jgi:hypothetical protein
MRPRFFALAALAAAASCSEYDLRPDKSPGPGADTAPPEDPPPPDSGPPPDTAAPPDCADFPRPALPSATPDDTCLRPPTVGTLDPVVEWSAEVDLGFSTSPEVRHPYVTPVVANLTDDNGDGRIDRDDIPDIAFTAFEGGGGSGSGLRVLSGDGRAEHLFVAAVEWGGQSWPISRVGGVALADLEGDGRPDIVTIVMAADGTTGRVAALEADGTPKWVEPSAVTSRYSYPSIADLDGDGAAEVVVGHLVIDTGGALLAVGAAGTGAPDSNPNPQWGSISIPVDLDLDGAVEIVAGNTVYDAAGAVRAQSGLPDGFTAVGDLDLDGVGDIVTTVHSAGEVYAWSLDGAVRWRVATGAGGGGPPTIADFDGDGAPEIGVAGRTHYSVLEADGTLRWQAAIIDFSSSATGSSVFDFDGDGAAEVVFADERSFWVFDGATGAVLFEEPAHQHGTAWEYPIVADVDADGQVEVVLGSVSTSGEWNGITVLGSATASWTPARPLWNQHAYHLTNITADGAVPAVAAPNWLTWNTFRAAAPETGPAQWLPDLRPAEPALCLDTCAADTVTLYVGAVNAGLQGADRVDIALVDDAARVVHRGTLFTLPAGGGGLLGPLTLSRADWGDGSLRVDVDPDALHAECDEGDNTLSLGPWPCP